MNSPGSALRSTWISGQASFRAGSSSASPSPAPWRWTPGVILFDEPSSALDPELVQEVLDSMRALAAEGMTMVVVTHEMRFARSVAHRAVFMEDGRVIEQAPPGCTVRHPA